MHSRPFAVIFNYSSISMNSYYKNLHPDYTTMNSSYQSISYKEEQSILEGINKQKAALLAPAIFYVVFLMIIGVVVNPVAIFVYGWKWQNTTTRVFLFWLACLDLLNCVITMPTEIFVLSSFYYFPNAGFCRMSRFFTYVINNSTSAVFLAIAWDRYIRICHPHRQAMTLFGSKVACAVSLFIGTAVSWPAVLLYGRKIVPLPHPKYKNIYINGVICDIKNEMDDTPYPFAFLIYLWCAVSFCVLVLAVFYCLIGRVILKRRRQKKMKKEEKKAEKNVLAHSHSESGIEDVQDSPKAEVTVELKNDKPHTTLTRTRSDSAIEMTCADLSNFRISGRRIRPPKSTLMLFAITAVFVLSFLPFLIITIIRQHHGPTFYPSLSPLCEVIVNIFIRFYLLNNCTNPIVYGLCNSQFRHELKKLFSVKTIRRDSSLSRGESNAGKVTPF